VAFRWLPPARAHAQGGGPDALRTAAALTTNTPTDIREEPDRCDTSGRIAEPASKRREVTGKHPPERIGRDQQATQAHRVGNNKDSRHGGWRPTNSGANDRWGQSRLLIELPARRLARRDRGLDLDDDGREPIRPKPQQVDGAALSARAVGHLQDDFPAETLEAPGCVRHERGVLLIEQPIDLGAAPRRDQLEPRFEGREDPTQGVEIGSGNVAPLEQRDHCLRHVSSCRQIRLAPSPAPSQGAQHPPDHHVLHGSNRGWTRSSTAYQEHRGVHSRPHGEDREE
jgi:hypothetical protein